MKEDIPTKFWKKYYKADMLEREQILKKLPLIKEAFEISTLKKIPIKLRRYSLILTLRGYFDDLIDYMEYMKHKNGK